MKKRLFTELPGNNHVCLASFLWYHLHAPSWSDSQTGSEKVQEDLKDGGTQSVNQLFRCLKQVCSYEIYAAGSLE